LARATSPNLDVAVLETVCAEAVRPQAAICSFAGASLASTCRSRV
jgi:hypothetical protein